MIDKKELGASACINLALDCLRNQCWSILNLRKVVKESKKVDANCEVKERINNDVYKAVTILSAYESDSFAI